MKKLSVLIFLFTVSLLGAFRAPRVFAADDCSWTIDNGLKFCYGATTEQQLRNTRIEFQCASNCAGPIGTILGQGRSVQTYDNANASIGQGGGGVFSCTGGGIDQSFINAVRENINRQSTACGGIGAVTFGAATLISGGLSVPLHIAAAAAGVAGGVGITGPCLQVVNQFRPTVQARLVDKNSGSTLCSKDLTMNVNASNQITAAGGPLNGQTIQSGTGLEFCNGGKGITTALGCVPTDPSAFIGFILTIGIGLAGGIAFLLILWGGFQILTSAGNPEQLNAGRELVSSAIAGLLLIIFSVFILRLIGVNILGIPGFG